MKCLQGSLEHPPIELLLSMSAEICFALISNNAFTVFEENPNRSTHVAAGVGGEEEDWTHSGNPGEKKRSNC